jgi:hypothetical protein
VVVYGQSKGVGAEKEGEEGNHFVFFVFYGLKQNYKMVSLISES